MQHMVVDFCCSDRYLALQEEKAMYLLIHQ